MGLSFFIAKSKQNIYLYSYTYYASADKSKHSIEPEEENLDRKRQFLETKLPIDYYAIIYISQFIYLS